MLYLASQSPRRRELLGRLLANQPGLEFDVIELDIPEQRGPGEPAEQYVRRVAREKAGAGLLKVAANRKVLVAVYQGNGSTIVCYTFVGSEADAPEIAEVSFDAEKGMNFYRFFYNETNAVMHREGNIMCILMSQLAREKLLALARAKARTDHM